MEKIIAIAMAAHEINRAYCAALGDLSQPAWQDAPEWQRNSAIEGVKFHLANPEAGPEASHVEWSKLKIMEGWTYGETKDPERKTHPCLVPFEQLPREQQAKDHLFRATVHLMAAQQHRQIKGYRELGGDAIDLMNRVKSHGQATASLIAEVEAHVGAQFKATQPAYREPSNEAEEVIGTECIDTPEQTAAKVAEAERLKRAEPFRWLAMARTSMQVGTMELVRAVAQPESF